MKAIRIFQILVIAATALILVACDGGSAVNGDQLMTDTATSSDPSCSGIDIPLESGVCGHVDSLECPASARDNPIPGLFCLGYIDDACHSDSQSQACQDSCMDDSSIHAACAAFMPQLSEQASVMLGTKWTLKEYGYQMSEKNSPIAGTSDYLWFGVASSFPVQAEVSYQRSLDCNTTFGEYDIEDNVLTLKSGWTTLIFCPNTDNQDLQDQVEFISDVLANPVVFSIEGNLLTLTASDSAQLIYTGNVAKQ